MWYKLAQPQIKRIDPEEDWPEAEEAESIFKLSKIRCDSNKNVSHVAIENGQVIGALSSGWCRGDDYEGKSVAVFSFDLAVDPKHRRKGVGLSIIQAAMIQYNEEKETYAGQDGYSMMRVWVVNPILVPVLENLGFSIEAEHADDSAHLVYY
jgi:GNAT superfamily N-acetyltransferase